MLPSEFDEVRECPALRALLERQMNMQVEDLRVLLQLPAGDLKAGCNFAAASVLFNLISGVSVCFFHAGDGSSSPRSGRAERFKGLLRRYYPWQDEKLTLRKAVEVLYHWTRTPLTHSLGIDLSSRPNLALGKGPLPADRVRELENAVVRPDWLSPTIDPIELKTGTQLVISVPTLYWGFHRTMHNLFTDDEQRARAETYANDVRLAERDSAQRYYGA